MTTRESAWTGPKGPVIEAMAPVVSCVDFVDYGTNVRGCKYDEAVLAMHSDFLIVMYKITDTLKFKQVFIRECLMKIYVDKNFDSTLKKFHWADLMSKKVCTICSHFKKMVAKYSTRRTDAPTWMLPIMQETGNEAEGGEEEQKETDDVVEAEGSEQEQEPEADGEHWYTGKRYQG